jgi:hypothetical protein
MVSGTAAILRSVSHDSLVISPAERLYRQPWPVYLIVHFRHFRP